MKIIQKPQSPHHKSAMFFDGVIATEGNHSLVTYQTGELTYNGNFYVGKEIQSLIGIINDETIEDEVVVDILVDKFFVINYNGTLLEDYVYCDYDEAIKAFDDFLKEV